MFYSFLTQTTTNNLAYEDNRWHNTYSAYIYTSCSYVQNLRNVISVPVEEHKIYIHFWTLRASTHERPPCVLRHTGNAYAVSDIFTHTLPSTIEMAPRRSTLNGQRCIRHNNVFTSRTLALRDIQG